MKIQSVNTNADEGVVSIRNADGTFINIVLHDGDVTIYFAQANAKVSIAKAVVNDNQIVIRYNKKDRKVAP